MSRVKFLKTVLSHDLVTRNKAAPPVRYHNLPCRMSLTIQGPMAPVEFKNFPCRRVEFKKWPCRPVDVKGLDPYYS